jgi:hypothetical protein
MEPHSKHARRLSSLTTDELKRLWIEACKRLVVNPGGEEPDIADVEEELDLGNEGLPFHLVQNELAILVGARKGSSSH